MQNQRYYEIDFLKCISIITVVFIHSFSTSLRPTIWWEILIGDFTRFSVPSLFFAAGFLFDKTDASTGKIIRKKLLRLLPPYLFCSILFQLLNLPGIRVPLDQLTLKLFIFNIIIGDTIGIYYFVFVLSYLYAFSIILRKLPHRLSIALWAAVFLLTMYFVKSVFVEGYPFKILLRHPFFFPISYFSGWVFSLYNDRIVSLLKNNCFVLMLSTLYVVMLMAPQLLGAGFRSSPLLAQGDIFLSIAILVIIGLRISTFTVAVRYISDNSYGIFLLHFPIVHAVQSSTDSASGDFSFLTFIVAWLAGFLLSLLIIEGIRRVTGKYSVYLVGS